MSKIQLDANASGTGVFTIASPNSNTDRTFDLPDGAGTIAVASQLDNHNLIINGDGGVNQRGYTSGTATTGANEYTLDRWRVVTSGESLTFTGNEAGRTMTAPSGGVEQVIEGLNIAGGTYVITWTGTATGAVDGTTVSSGDTVTLTANTNATVKFTSGTFTNVKVEEGSIATPFRKRGYGEELAQCQRYCYVLNTTNDRYNHIGTNYLSTHCYFKVQYPVVMRSAPSASQNTILANAYSAGAARATNAAITINNSFTLSSQVLILISGTAGYVSHVDLQSGQLTFDAEL